MKVKSFFQDVLGTARVTKRRKEVIKKASSIPQDEDPISDVAKALHRGKFMISVSSMKEVSDGSKIITFSSSNKRFPYFKSGQYLTLEMKIDGSVISRPFTICSAPYETRGGAPSVSILVEKKEDGFVSKYLLNEIKIGDEFLAEVGLGFFFYESLRDSEKVIAFCEGVGISSFCSMAKEIKYGDLNFNLTIYYVKKEKDDCLLKEELEKYICDKVRISYVEKEKLSDLKEMLKEDASYFISGSKEMCLSLKGRLLDLSVSDRRIRYSIVYPFNDVSSYDSYPKENKDKTFKIKVLRGIKENTIEASSDEPIAVSLERAGIKIHTGCRSGECGLCRITVEEGEYYVIPFHDGRRKADKEFNYVHACMTYPLSDLVIRVAIQ